MPLSQEHLLYTWAIGSDSFLNTPLFQPEKPPFLKYIFWFVVFFFSIFFLLHWPCFSLKKPSQQTAHQSSDGTAPWSTSCTLQQHFCSLSLSLPVSRGQQHGAAAQGGCPRLGGARGASEATATSLLSSPGAQPSAEQPSGTHRRVWRGLYPPMLLLFHLTLHGKMKCWGTLLRWFALPPHCFLPGVSPNRQRGTTPLREARRCLPWKRPCMHQPGSLHSWLRSFPNPVGTTTLHMSTRLQIAIQDQLRLQGLLMLMTALCSAAGSWALSDCGALRLNRAQIHSQSTV